jgi:phage terminase large subunit-like protein
LSALSLLKEHGIGERDAIEFLRKAEAEELTQEQLDTLRKIISGDIRWDWRHRTNARPNQIAPEGDWMTWLVLAGRGFGKTRTGAEWVRENVTDKTASRIALIAETQKDLEEVMVFGDSGIMSVFPPHQKPIVTKKPIKITFHTGAIASGYNAIEPDQLRGPQFDLAWGDELAKWRYARETWDQLQFGLRLGKHPRQIVTTTPRPIPILKEILVAKTTVVTRGVTTDNNDNLAPSFIKAITDKYAGTRLGRQELSAEILDDVPDALWTRASLDRDRRKQNEIPALKRIVVAIDPAAKQNDTPEDGAATGIIVAGVGDDNRGYVLDDATCRESPNGWARMAVACFDRYQGDCIVGEINNGGDMVAATVRAVRPTVPFREVHASRGKWTRAEPIAALYEQGRVSHVGTFASLEDEMVNFGPNGMVGDASPDRVDALVWALTELFPAIVKAPKKAGPPAKIPNLSPKAYGRGNGWMARQ